MFKKKDAADAELFLRLFGSEDGQRFLQIWKARVDIHSEWPTDPIEMATLAGRQGEYKWITGTMRAAKAIRRGDVEIMEDDVDVRFNFKYPDRRG